MGWPAGEDVMAVFEQHDLQAREWPDFKCFRAMSLFQVGRAENGIENLRLANDKLDRVRESSFLRRPRWWHLAQGELLRDEAEALMRGE